MGSPDADRIERLAHATLRQALDYAESIGSDGQVLDPAAAKKIHESRLELLNTTQELHDEIQGPLDYIRKELTGHCNLVYLHAAYKFKLCENVPLIGDISYQELACKCNVEEDKLRRIIRFAITRRFFKESRLGYVSHSLESRAVANTPGMDDYIGTICEEMWPSATLVVNAMVKWPGSEERKHSGYVLANGLELSMFDILQNHPERAARFARFMNLFSAAPFFSYRYLCDAYDWSKVTTMVDLGGGKGGQAIALAQRFPSIHCITQDLAVIHPESTQQIPLNLRQRVKFQGHDFFTEQPVKNADVYHFRWVFHDWPDRDCVSILQALIPALKKDAKIIVTDGVIPLPGSVPRYMEWAMRTMDFVMLELNNAKERDINQWKSLFSAADERFVFEDVKKVEGSRFSYLIVNWEG